MVSSRDNIAQFIVATGDILAYTIINIQIAAHNDKLENVSNVYKCVTTKVSKTASLF